MTPGAKRPWLIESDDVSHPADEDDGRPSDLEAGRGAGVGATVASSAAPTVTASRSGASACPQLAQNRALLAVAAPQPGQDMRGFYGSSSPAITLRRRACTKRFAPRSDGS